MFVINSAMFIYYYFILWSYRLVYIIEFGNAKKTWIHCSWLNVLHQTIKAGLKRTNNIGYEHTRKRLIELSFLLNAKSLFLVIGTLESVYNRISLLRQYRIRTSSHTMTTFSNKTRKKCWLRMEFSNLKNVVCSLTPRLN